VANCTVVAMTGNPEMFQEYWTAHPSASADILPNYRTTYRISSAPLNAVQDTIRQLHTMIGNAVVEGKTIVCGYGGTQLLHAAFYAVNAVKPGLSVFSQTPYYSYSEIIELNARYGNWNYSYDQNASQVFEIVTTPNNPDGEIRSAYYLDAAFQLLDLVYYWPSFTNISQMYDADIMIFSASKMTGHAGNRFGWALVKDRAIAQQMTTFIADYTYGISTDTQYKMLQVLNDVVSSEGDVFYWAKEKLASRYDRLLEILDSQPSPQRFSLESPVGSFYLWIKCLWPEDQSNCVNSFRAGRLSVFSGTRFGGGNDYVRVSFTMYDHLADSFFDYFRALAFTNQTDYIEMPSEFPGWEEKDMSSYL